MTKPKKISPQEKIYKLKNSEGNVSLNLPIIPPIDVVKTTKTKNPLIDITIYQNSQRLRISANVGRMGLEKLQQILTKYQEILEIMDKQD